MDANPTLDQLQVFLTVAETGSFSAAARALNRAQSVVSYTIANLEAQLEVVLFERNGVRQPKLTDEGRAMLEDARRIVAGLQEMRARAKGLKQGLEAELSVAISTMVPAEAVVAVLRDFREQFPTVTLSLNVGELGMVMDMVLSRRPASASAGRCCARTMNSSWKRLAIPSCCRWLLPITRWRRSSGHWFSLTCARRFNSW